MFRKIHSNRNPGDTLFSALGNEFAVYRNAAKIRVQAFLVAYPKPVFGIMVICILASAVLTLTVLRPGKSGPKPTVKTVTETAGRGFSQILSTADALRETLRIKQEISAIIARDTLTAADSLRLEKALDRFHQLTQTSNPNAPN